MSTVSCSDSLGPLRIGSRLVHTGRPTPAEYAQAAGTLYFGVPTVWSRVCAEPEAARPWPGRASWYPAPPRCQSPVFARLEALTGLRPAERYGMTETLITVAARAADPAAVPGWSAARSPGSRPG